MFRRSTNKFLKRCYRRLLLYYPQRLTAEFSAEMAEVFDERISRAGKSSVWAGFRMLFQELFDLAGILIRSAHKRQEWTMQQRIESEDVGSDSNQTILPGIPRLQAWQLILGLFPLLIAPGIGITLLLTQPSTPKLFEGFIGFILSGIVLIMLVLIYSWKHNFPVWTYPYWGITVPWTFFMMVISTPGLIIFGIPVFGNEIWGGRALIPLMIVFSVGLLLTRSFNPVTELVKNISRDWTLISFALYLPIQWLLWIAYDEMHGEGLFLASMQMILAAGALVYLISSSKLVKIAALLGGLALSWIPSGVYIWHYWDGRVIPGLSEPISGLGNLIGMAIWSIFMAALLCLPGIIVTILRILRKPHASIPPSAAA